jgi:serine/threonine-protein kinase
MSTPTPTADRNLIFGLLALQMDFVSREQLLEVMTAWMLQKHTPLGEILCRRGVLAEDERQLLDLALEKHVRRHGSDPQASLAALRVEPQLRQDLDRLEDPEVRASIASLSPCPVEAAVPATRPPLVGHTTAPPPPRPGWADSLANAPTTPPTPPPAAGMRYHRLREHAKGGLGEVFVALDEELDREVALKEIQNRHADHPEARARFLREAEVTGKLEHPGVVPVYGMGHYPDGRPFYGMRFNGRRQGRRGSSLFPGGWSGLHDASSTNPLKVSALASGAT